MREKHDKPLTTFTMKRENANANANANAGVR